MAGYNPYAPPTQDPGSVAPAMAGGPTGAPVPWTISEVLNVGFSAVRRRPLELIGGYFLVGLLGQLPGQLPLVLTLAGVVSEGTALYWGLQGVSILGALIVSSYLLVGQLRVALAAARGEDFDFGLFFSGGDRLVTMFAAILLISLAGALGFVLLIVPGVVLVLGWALASLFVADTDYGALEAMRESWEAMRGQKLQVFLLYLTTLVVCLAGLCACYVGLFVVLPAVVIAYAETYRRITGRLGGATASVSAEVPPGPAWMAPPGAP